MLWFLLFLFRNLLNIMRRSSGNSNQKTYVICPKGWTLDHLKEVGCWTAHKRKINLIALKLPNRSKSCVSHGCSAFWNFIWWQDKSEITPTVIYITCNCQAKLEWFAICVCHICLLSLEMLKESQTVRCNHGNYNHLDHVYILMPIYGITVVFGRVA